MLVSSRICPTSMSQPPPCWTRVGKNGPPVSSVSCDALTVLSTPMLTDAAHDVIQYAATIKNRPPKAATATVRPGDFDSSEKTGAASNPTYAVMHTTSAGPSVGPLS